MTATVFTGTPRVLLCATTTGYQIRSFGAAARALGVRLLFASDSCDQLDDPWWDQAIPIRFHEEDAAVQTVTRALAEAPPDGVIAVGDRPVVVAARLARAFGLRGHVPSAAATSRNKLASRLALASARLPVPWFRGFCLHEDDRTIMRAVTYPAVIKPLQLSGSCGVMRVDSQPEFIAGIARLRRLMDSSDLRADHDATHEAAIIESFIPGGEVAVEGVLTEGKLMPLAIFDKPDRLDGPFFEETIYVTPSRHEPSVQSAIVEQVGAAARAIGLWHGPVHAECRVNAEGVFVLELAARPIGGLCANAVRLVSARGEPSTLEELILRHSLGEDVTAWRQAPSAAGVMMIPIPRRGVYRATDGIEEALAVEGVESVRITAKVDSVLVPLPEGRSYLGFIFASGLSPDDVERSLRGAHARLRFQIEREIPFGVRS